MIQPRLLKSLNLNAPYPPPSRSARGTRRAKRDAGGFLAALQHRNPKQPPPHPVIPSAARNLLLREAHHFPSPSEGELEGVLAKRGAGNALPPPHRRNIHQPRTIIRIIQKSLPSWFKCHPFTAETQKQPPQSLNPSKILEILPKSCKS